MAIDWENKPKWLTEEKVYALACAEITNDRKMQVLKAMANKSNAGLQAIGMIDSSKSFTFFGLLSEIQR